MAVIVPILSTFNDKGIKSAVREFQTAKTSIQKFGAVGKIFEGVGKSLTKNLTVPLAAAAAGIYAATQAASTLEESLSKTNAVFGKSADEIINWSKSSATAFGSSRQAALEAVSTYGNLFQAFGLSTDQAAEFSTNIVQLAGDLASFNNVPIEDVFIALRSGLSGETEPLKRFGVALSDQRLRAEAAALGLGKFTGQLPVAIKSQAAYSLILKDTALAQGDYARTADGLANQQRTLQAEVQNLVAEFGTAFLPVMKQLVTVVRDQIVPQLQKFSKFIRDLSPETISLVLKIGALLAVLGPMLILVGKIISAIVLFTKVFKVLTLVFAANPLGLILTAISLLVVAFITAYKTSEKFRNVINGVLNFLISAFEVWANAVIANVNLFIRGLNKMIEGAKLVGLNFESIAEIGEVSFKRLSTSTKTYSQDISTMSDYAKEMAGISSNQVAPALEDVATGLQDTGNKAGKAKDKIKELRDALVNMRQEAVTKLEESLRSAENQLDSARGKFNEFKNAIAGNITGLLDFAKASEGDNFVQGLVGQAADATAFANKVKQLIQLGLSERGITEVLNAGFEAGTRIADELIAGGSTVVQQVNTLLASVASVADQVGDFGARQFYQAGVTQGEALVNGILDSLRAAQAELAAAQRAALSGGGIGDFKNLGARATGLLGQIQGLSGKAQSNALADFSRALEQSKGAPAISTKELAAIQKKYKLAKGGIVMGPTNALIGEAGPEAVVPLSGANSAGLGNTINITINAGMGTDGAAVGRQVVDAIKKYERISGPVFAKA
jgi:hypothetical protein